MSTAAAAVNAAISAPVSASQVIRLVAAVVSEDGRLTAATLASSMSVPAWSSSVAIAASSAARSDMRGFLSGPTSPVAAPKSIYSFWVQRSARALDEPVEQPRADSNGSQCGAAP